ncbi:Rpn family recombination-promoting nuclease/putative transposase [Desulfobulbus alkaliphilus]|uniref:Rpn family recombination-promoting nuclease/putative transposase n=1 Tax=Desulfobulbus alkaliphilus TaxID=869814 RepID=UPI0019630E7D|nr:Rpn family recombination-promoting nuclease/putative transposase [Desulfobulbus alkaliphilus]MBM9538599.1 Rpn family recombination-promoting nuclease/putative transposase [Desulfobulbus alkaliphilus]
MPQDIANPHDKLIKQILGEPENAASFLAANLPAELVSHLDLKTLTVVQASFIDAQFTQSEADLLFSVTIANRPGYVYLLIEHQSSPDVWMKLRLLSYMVRVWKRFQREKPASQRLPAIIPLVVFHGAKGWQGPVTFDALVDIPHQCFLPYTPTFQCKLFDLSAHGMEELAGNAMVRVISDLFRAQGLPETEGLEKLRSAFTTLNELAQAPGFAQYLEIVFRYVLQISDMPQEQLGQMVNQTIKHDVEDVIMTTYEKLRQEGELIGLQKGRMEGRMEGRVEGRMEGRMEGAGRVLLRLLAKRFPEGTDHLLPLLQELTPEQQDELSEKILDATSLEEIHAWLKSIRGN